MRLPDEKRDISESRLNLAFLYFLSFFILSILYIFYVSPVWSYMGFVYELNYSKLFLSIFVLLFFVLIKSKKIDVRNYFLNIITTITLIPSLVIYTFADKPTYSAFVVWIAVFTVTAVSAVPLPRFTVMRANSKYILFALMISTIGVISIFFSRAGFSNFNLDLNKVYEFRGQSSEAFSGVFSYLLSTFTKSIIPFSIVLSIYYKNYFFTALLFIIAVLFFGITGNKGIVAYAILSIFIFYFLRYSPKYSTILTAFVFVLIGALLSVLIRAYVGPGSIFDWYASLVVRRALLVPALLDYYYIEFFSQNSWAWWADSRISFGLTENSYEVPLPNVIGKAYFDSESAAANTGFIGSGFAQAGLIGTIIYSVGVGLVIAFLRAYGRYLGLPLVAAMMTSQVMTMFISTDFITLFLTHGMLVSLFVLAMIREPQNPTSRSLGSATP